MDGCLQRPQHVTICLHHQQFLDGVLQMDQMGRVSGHHQQRLELGQHGHHLETDVCHRVLGQAEQLAEEVLFEVKFGEQANGRASSTMTRWPTSVSRWCPCCPSSSHC